MKNHLHKISKILCLVLFAGAVLLPAAMAVLPVAEASNAAQNIFSDTKFSNPTDVEVTGMAAPGDIKGFTLSLIRIVKNAVSVVAVLAIVVVGIRIVTAIDGDSQVATQRKILLGIVTGLVIINIAEPFVYTLYQQNGTIPGGTDEAYSRIAAMKFQRDLVEPMINFAMSFVAGIAVFMIVVSGMRMITAAGDEGQMKQQQFVMVESILGLFVILVAQPIVKAVYGYQNFNVFQREFASPNIGFGINVLVQVMNYLLSFFFLGALAMLVYAGYLMVAHFGQSDLVDRGKKIIRYTITAIIIAISAYTLVAWLVTLTP